MNSTDGQCVCPESYELSSDSTTCVCPSTTTLYNDYCYTCNIQYCDLCQANSICSNCTSPFVPSSDGSSCVCLPTFVKQGSTCVCATGQVNNGSQCVPCIDDCYSCSTTTTCDECNPSYLLNTTDGSCYCN